MFSSQVVAVVSGPSSWIKGRLIAFIGEVCVRISLSSSYHSSSFISFFFLPSCLFVRFYSAVFLCSCWYCFCCGVGGDSFFLLSLLAILQKPEGFQDVSNPPSCVF